VTDAKDRITLNCLLLTFFCQDSLEEDYKYSPSGKYFCPEANGSMEDYQNYVRSLPQFPKPEIFGMHENAAITKEVNETKETLF
jgi:dynein heavy chain